MARMKPPSRKMTMSAKEPNVLAMTILRPSAPIRRNSDIAILWTKNSSSQKLKNLRWVFEKETL